MTNQQITELAERIAERFDSLALALHRIAFAHERAAKALDRMSRGINPPPAQQPPVEIVPVSERTQQIVYPPLPFNMRTIDMDIQQFALRLPAHPTPDVVRREVTLSIDADLPSGLSLPIAQLRVVQGRDADTTSPNTDPNRDIANEGAFEVPQGLAFTVSTVAIDDAGNASDPTVQQFTAIDQTPPAAGGVEAVVAVSERHVDLPSEGEVAPTDPPAEEPATE